MAVSLGLGACSGGGVGGLAPSGSSDSNKPLPDRMISKPEDLKGETLQTLAAQGGALLIVRAYGDKVSSGFLGFGGSQARDGALVMLSDVSPGSAARAATMIFGKDTGEEATTGWGITVARPGKYFLDAMVAGKGHASLHSGQARRQTAEVLGQTVEVKAGEVVYLGTVRTRTEGQKVAVGVDDETAAARAYMERQLPGFAGAMTTRLLDCGCNVKKQIDEAIATLEKSAKVAPAKAAATASKKKE